MEHSYRSTPEHFLTSATIDAPLRSAKKRRAPFSRLNRITSAPFGKSTTTNKTSALNHSNDDYFHNGSSSDENDAADTTTQHPAAKRFCSKSTIVLRAMSKETQKELMPSSAPSSVGKQFHMTAALDTGQSDTQHIAFNDTCHSPVASLRGTTTSDSSLLYAYKTPPRCRYRSPDPYRHAENKNDHDDAAQNGTTNGFYLSFSERNTADEENEKSHKSISSPVTVSHSTELLTPTVQSASSTVQRPLLRSPSANRSSTPSYKKDGRGVHSYASISPLQLDVTMSVTPPPRTASSSQLLAQQSLRPLSRTHVLPEFPSFPPIAVYHHPISPSTSEDSCPTSLTRDTLLANTPSPRTPSRSSAHSPPRLASPSIRLRDVFDLEGVRLPDTPQAPLRPFRARRNLLHGILSGNRREVADALTSGEDPNLPIKLPPRITGKAETMLPLLAAARLGHAGVLETLLEGGSVVNSVNSLGQNALHIVFAQPRPRFSSADMTTTPLLVASKTPVWSTSTANSEETSSVVPQAWLDLKRFFDGIDTVSHDENCSPTVSATAGNPDSEKTPLPIPPPQRSSSLSSSFPPETSSTLHNRNHYSFPNVEQFSRFTAAASQARGHQQPSKSDILLCAEILIREGIDCHRQDENGKTPKSYALEYGLPIDHPFFSSLTAESPVTKVTKKKVPTTVGPKHSAVLSLSRLSPHQQHIFSTPAVSSTTTRLNQQPGMVARVGKNNSSNGATSNVINKEASSSSVAAVTRRRYRQQQLTVTHCCYAAKPELTR